MSSTKLELARRLALTVAGFGFTPTDEERWGRRMAKSNPQGRSKASGPRKES
jgi:hypothetical protein